jgi:hypothetical protein
VAMCMAVGKLSFDDWPMLTWSLGCTGRFVPSVPPRQLAGPVADDLVDVHVRLGAGPGLPYIERELRVEPARDHLVGGLDDGGGALGVEPAGVLVDQGGGLLDVAVGVVDRLRHAVVTDREVDQ